MGSERIQGFIGSIGLLLLSVCISGCETQDDEPVCAYQGAFYSPAQDIPEIDDCMDCVCGPEGVLQCDISLCEASGCPLGDGILQNGQTGSAPDGCNLCTCFEGELECSALDCGAFCHPGDVYESVPGCPPCICGEDSQILCPHCEVTCFYEGVGYQEGEAFPYGDVCNECVCLASGDVYCTAAPCAQDCTYYGETYEAGDYFAALGENECGQCVCHPDGVVDCFFKACENQCYYDNIVYQEGDTFTHADGCNLCQCMYGGVISCITGPCEGECEHDGQPVQNGSRVPSSVPCEKCTCIDGEVVCALDGCSPGCMYDGEYYPLDETFPMVEGCGTCACVAPGEVTCVLSPCDSCLYEGVPYEPGNVFASSDGCNQCVCGEDFEVSCGTLSCDCDPPVEWDREYVSLEEENCADLVYDCPGNTAHFINGCGCGCVQSETCLQVYHCGHGTFCSFNHLSEECPFSLIVL